MTRPNDPRFDVNAALRDPGAFYKNPSAVVGDDRLKDPLKLEVLRRWGDYEEALQRADNEGMHPEGAADVNADKLKLIKQAISRVERRLARARGAGPAKPGGASKRD